MHQKLKSSNFELNIRFNLHKYFFYAIKLLIEFVKLTKVSHQGNIKVEIKTGDYVQYLFKKASVFKKFIYSEKATKFLQNLHLTFDWHYILKTKVRWSFCKILCPSQNI